MNYDKLAKEMRSRRGKPYPVNKYNFKSEKYHYISNISIDGIEFWHACLSGIVYYATMNGFGGITSWDYYSDSEEKCAEKCYKEIKKNIKWLTRHNKQFTSKKYNKHINWEIWMLNYESLHGIMQLKS